MFGSDSMAEGYAKARPPVHPLIVARAVKGLALRVPARRALDLGCGSGVSTAALRGFATSTIGIEPEFSMLRWAGAVAPGAMFAAGSAERIPIAGSSIDLITAAGSLNFADATLALREIRRILAPGGSLLIYDFRQGSDFRESALLAGWHREFKTRYPAPPSHAFDPASLPYAECGLHLDLLEAFEAGIELSPDFYLNYAMTETNVAAAVSRGVPEQDIRDWCIASLTPVFGDEVREVVFHGYFAGVSARA